MRERGDEILGGIQDYVKNERLEKYWASYKSKSLLD